MPNHKKIDRTDLAKKDIKPWNFLWSVRTMVAPSKINHHAIEENLNQS